MSDLNRKDFTKKEWRAEYLKRYAKTETGKASSKRYNKSEKCKTTRKRYAQSEQGKATHKRYRQTKKRKSAVKRYNKSEKGKVNRRKNWIEFYARKLNATVSWADETKINLIYERAVIKTTQTGRAYEVDHIVPLQGKTVCGLHIQGNLRVILATTNAKKGATFTPTTEQLVLRLAARDQARNNC